MNASVVPVAWRLPSPVFGVKLADLFKDLAVYVGVIGWFVGVAMNLAGSVQNPVQVGWFLSVRPGWLLSLTELGLLDPTLTDVLPDLSLSL